MKIKIKITLFLILASLCYGTPFILLDTTYADVYTSHQLPHTDSTLDVGSSDLFWHFFYGNAFTDGTAYWESNQLYGFDEIIGTTIIAEVDLIGETITGVDISGVTITDGIFVVSGGEISAGEIIATFGDIDIGGNTLTSWDIYTGQIISHSTTDPQLLLRHTTGVDEAGFYVDSDGDLTITPTGDVVFQPIVDSTTFFQILDADGGIPIFNVDTTNERVGIGTPGPTQPLHVKGDANSYQYKVQANSISANDWGGIGFSVSTDDAGAVVSSIRAIRKTGSTDIDLDFRGNSDGTSIIYLDSSEGNVGFATESPTGKVDINSDEIRIRSSQTPAGPSATGTQGDICWDSGYIYVAVATNTWKRAQLSTWGIPAENVIYAGEDVIYAAEQVVYP